MKSLVLLWQRTAADAAVQCRTSATKDSKRVLRRFEHEGIELLTLSLPEIGKAFERSLDQGQVTDDLLSLCGSKAGFPVFLRNFLQLVFERSDGRLLDEPSVDAIQAVRQLTLMFGKVLFPCKTSRVEQAFSDFVQCEQELRISDSNISAAMLADFERIGSVLFRDIFTELDRKVYEGEVVPKHGPGATADRIRGNAKYRQREWTERLERIFPATENLIPNFRYISSLDELKYLDPGAERPVRVIAVPKTLKTPRIIAIEPLCMQYMQQGVMEIMVDALESRFIRSTENPVHGMLGFTDQEPNQLLARKGSSDGSLATLDLSEASDRVSLRLVSAITHRFRHFFEAVMATRSYRADVPGHGVIPLAKFASMGSALTFPMEECVFLTCIFYAVEQGLGRHLTQDDVKSFQGRVRVYGDDLIVPVEIVPRVVEALELFGFKVNRNKSFWTGKFRESCGKEYYDGHEVTVFRVRRSLPSHRADAPGVVSTVALRNQAYWQGYWGVARYLDTLLEDLIPLPNVSSSSKCLGRETVLGYEYPGMRFHPYLHHPLVRGMAIRSQIPASKLSDEWALQKYFLKRGDKPYADERHLERQGRPNAVGIKLGWHRPY